MEIEVFKAINAVQAELVKKGIAKNNLNTQQGYKFRGIDDIYNVLSEILSQSHLCIIPEVLERSQVERRTIKGGVIFYSFVRVKYTLISAIDGSHFESIVYGEAMDSADKSTNKAMSAAYKYMCLQTFCIPTIGDNDSDATTPDSIIPEEKPAEKAPAKKEPTLAERVAGFKKYIAGAGLDELNSAKYKAKFNALLENLQEEEQRELTAIHNERAMSLMKGVE